MREERESEKGADRNSASLHLLRSSVRRELSIYSGNRKEENAFSSDYIEEKTAAER